MKTTQRKGTNGEKKIEKVKELQNQPNREQDNGKKMRTTRKKDKSAGQNISFAYKHIKVNNYGETKPDDSMGSCTRDSHCRPGTCINASSAIECTNHNCHTGKGNYGNQWPLDQQLDDCKSGLKVR